MALACVFASDVGAQTAPGPFRAWLPAPQDSTRMHGLIGLRAPFPAQQQAMDLTARVTGLGELGGSWTRYEPCDPSVHFNCNPSLFPVMRPNVEFGVLVTGTISDRVFVDVDYDQRREDFETANRIRVYYQGLEGELLQRVEVGDVSLTLPRSRFVTRGVPAGNFGFMARGGQGPFEFQALWAQQKGSVSTREFRLGGAGTQSLVQDDQLVLDDADYVKGQFFFLVSPDSLAGAPHVDALRLLAGDAPASLRPAAGGAIELYRDERLTVLNPEQQAQLGLFLADASSADASIRHSGRFRRLVPDEDYWVHASGLWIVLRSPMRPDEALALAYVTESGDTVGTIGAERAPAGSAPELRLLRGPVSTHQPDRATWPLEMHQVYRLTNSGDVDVTSIDLRISAGELVGGRTFVSVAGRQIPFIRLFGLDEDAPRDALDAAQVFQPARESFGSTRISGTYIIFPTLEPFLTPPPVPSEGLTADESRIALGGDANATIYEQTDPVLREGGGRFRLDFRYRLQVEGVIESFSLGQFGIREGSERLELGDRALVRDVDYVIDYELGTVTLLDAESLFGAAPEAALRATWEQRALFDIAPTNLFGLTASWALADRGELSVVGLYQAERSLYARPQLGVEPSGILLGGAGLTLDLGGDWLEQWMSRSTLLAGDVPATLSLDAELALSAPNPNRDGDAYLDDFEATDEVPLDVRRQQWKLGSAPASLAGADASFPAAFDATTAASLVWQHDIAEGGVITGNLLPQQIDQAIRVAGTPLPEPVMRLTFGENGPADAAWRSITTVLSTTGRDFTRSEFLEFYARADAGAPLSIVIDLGTVGEDAFYVDGDGNVTGVYPDGEPWGLGLLDEEASTAEREIWGADRDARGLWDQSCSAEPLKAYPLGDPRANCTRGNGIPDTEDLDGNGVLDGTDGDHFRFVVRLDEPSQFLARDTTETGTQFRLYRIPLRAAVGVPINGASDATWRFVKHLRLSVVGQRGASGRDIALARLRIVGSRWAKRDAEGILRGLLGREPGIGSASTRLRVGPAGQLTDGATYTPPPGVTDELQDPAAQFGGTGIEFNEKSLRIAYDGLEPGDRAEVYLRYPQQPRNLLIYRQMRLWALPRAGAWGSENGERLIVKVGADPDNYYLFQSPLRPPTGARPATEADWLPEVVIDFGAWFDLKARAQELGGTGPDTLWSDDGSYAIVYDNLARSPNLAAVRELSFGVYNGGLAPSDGEVWIDDLRLGSGVTDAGLAGAVALDLRSAFVDVGLSYSRRGAVYRQLEEQPLYQASGSVDVLTRFRMGRLLPETWNIDAPLTVEYGRSDIDPMFLERTDVRADRLSGLRQAGSNRTRVGIQLRRLAPLEASQLDLLLAGATLRFGWGRTRTGTFTASDESDGFDLGFDYRLAVVRQDVAAVPAFLASALRWLAPSAVEESDAFQRLLASRLRLTPEQVGFGSTYHDRESRSSRFGSVLVDTADAAPIVAPRQGLDNTAQVRLAPFAPLTATLALQSSRDLLDPARATTREEERIALERARSSLAGADIGWETRRSINTDIAFRPVVAEWIRPSYSFNSRYATDRNPSYITLVEGPNGALLQRRFGNERQITKRVDLRPGTLVEALFGVEPPADSAAGAEPAVPAPPVPPAAPAGFGGFLYRLGRAFQSLDITATTGLNTRYERETLSPGLGYQLGIGGGGGFRIIGSDTSVYALDRSDFRVGSSFLMPANGSLNVGYQRSRLDGLDARGGQRTERSRSWPDLRLAFRQLPVPPGMRSVLTGISVGAGWTHARRSSVYGARDDLVRTGEDDRVPVDFSLSFAGGVNATYAASVTWGSTSDPTGDAENRAANHALRVTAAFATPSFLQPKVTSPIRSTLNMSSDAQRRCRFRIAAIGEEGECVAYVDTELRSIDLTLDASMGEIDVGLRLDFTDRRNYVGTRTGSKQFQLGLFGRFQFDATSLPGIR